MTHPNEDLVRAASAAFGRGDLSALQDQYFAENIIWHIAGTGPLAGDHEGIAQVMGRPELHDVLVSTDHTVALATIRAERPGKQLRLNVVHVIHSENGKATEVWTHSADPAAAAEFWA